MSTSMVRCRGSLVKSSLMISSMACCADAKASLWVCMLPTTRVLMFVTLSAEATMSIRMMRKIMATSRVAPS